MDRVEFKRSLLAMHQDSPQRAAHVDMAVNGMFECLDKLATFGHTFEVQPVDFMFQGSEWPKTMYHQREPQGKVFHAAEHVPQEEGWQDRPLGAEGQETAGEAQPAGLGSGGPRIDEAQPQGAASPYPKKLFHPDIPGGVEVPNAETEDDYKARGWSEALPDRGDVDFGSRTDRFEGRDGGPPERSTTDLPKAQAMRTPVPASMTGGSKAAGGNGKKGAS